VKDAPTHARVDLRRTLLNVDALLKAAAALRQRNLLPASTPVWSAPAGVEVRQQRRQRQRRLSPAETARLHAQYRAGLTVAELSRQFGVSETTVRVRLRGLNSPLRRKAQQVR
jgi:DNA-directed RNA polymerase specialized sigma24 family protein